MDNRYSILINTVLLINTRSLQLFFVPEARYTRSDYTKIRIQQWNLRRCFNTMVKYSASTSSSNRYSTKNTSYDWRKAPSTAWLKMTQVGVVIRQTDLIWNCPFGWGIRVICDWLVRCQSEKHLHQEHGWTMKKIHLRVYPRCYFAVRVRNN